MLTRFEIKQITSETKSIHNVSKQIKEHVYTSSYYCPLLSTAHAAIWDPCHHTDFSLVQATTKCLYYNNSYVNKLTPSLEDMQKENFTTRPTL